MVHHNLIFYLSIFIVQYQCNLSMFIISLNSSSTFKKYITVMCYYSHFCQIEFVGALFFLSKKIQSQLHRIHPRIIYWPAKNIHNSHVEIKIENIFLVPLRCIVNKQWIINDINKNQLQLLLMRRHEVPLVW